MCILGVNYIKWLLILVWENKRKCRTIAYGCTFIIYLVRLFWLSIWWHIQCYRPHDKPDWNVQYLYKIHSSDWFCVSPCFQIPDIKFSQNDSFVVYFFFFIFFARLTEIYLQFVHNFSFHTNGIYGVHFKRLPMNTSETDTIVSSINQHETRTTISSNARVQRILSVFNTISMVLWNSIGSFAALYCDSENDGK